MGCFKIVEGCVKYRVGRRVRIGCCGALLREIRLVINENPSRRKPVWSRYRLAAEAV